MTKIQVNGVGLNTVVDGDDGSDKPWIVLSNSLGSNLSMWDDQIETLSRTYRVLRYDTRGHGGSDIPTGDYQLADLVADVVGLMDAHRIDKAAFMGLSMGGMTGMGLALLHPSRFSGIVVCDARADAPEGFKKSWDDRSAFIRDNGMAALVAPTLERWLSPSFRESAPERARWLGDMVANTAPDGYIGCAMALKQLDYLKDLPKVTVPMLYVGGEIDAGAMPDVMQAMADATPGADYIQIEGAAHIANVDNPAAFNSAIAPFLALER